MASRGEQVNFKTMLFVEFCLDMKKPLLFFFERVKVAIVIFIDATVAESSL